MTVRHHHYAYSKLAMEFIARTWFDQLPIVIARPFNYTRLDQPEEFLIPKLVPHYADWRPVIELRNSDVERDFSDLVAKACVRLIGSDKTSAVVNVCSGAERSLRWVQAELRATTAHDPTLRVAAQLVRRTEVHRLIGSNRRLIQIVGEPPFHNFAAMLHAMVGHLTSLGPARA